MRAGGHLQHNLSGLRCLVMDYAAAGIPFEARAQESQALRVGDGLGIFQQVSYRIIYQKILLSASDFIVSFALLEEYWADDVRMVVLVRLT